MSPEREPPATLSTEPSYTRRPVASGKNPGVVWLVWSLCALALVLIGLTALIASLGWSAPLLEESAPWYGQAFLAAASVGAPLLGALIASRHPENLYGWLWLGFGLALAVLSFGGNYAEYATLSGNLPAPVTAAAVGSAGWVAWVALTPFLILLFPDGRLPSPRWRFVVWTVAAAGAVCIAFGPFVPGQSSIASVENLFGVEGRAGVIVTALVAAGVFVIFGCTLLSALSLIFRFRRADGVQRQQIKWFVYAAVLFCGSLIFSGFLGQDLPGVWDALFEAVTLSGLYVAVGIAVLRYRLFDIDLLINRTLVYGALTACVICIYVFVVGYLGELFRSDGNLLVSLVATGVIAVLFAPLRDRLQRIVNRLMYGERDDPYAVLSRLGQRLEATLSPGAMLPAVVDTVAETLKLPHAALEIERDGLPEVVASTGEPVKVPVYLPLVHGGETVGRLVLGTRAGEEDFASTDRRLLGDLARQAGVAVHAALLADEAVRLSADLQRSRERLVSAREEERRRLRRDLHDGLGPQLASLTMKAEAARDLVPVDPDRADSLLGDLTEQAQAAVADIRRLVYALRPPALDALGLVGAIRSHASQYNNGGLRVAIEAPEGDNLPPLPAAVEVAAYRIALEALNNAARHADARNCEVRLSLDEEPDMLILEVSDDGRGIGEDRCAGVGLSSMRERAEELGGSCVVEPLSSGGTIVRAWLPRAQHDTETGPREA